MKQQVQSATKTNAGVLDLGNVPAGASLLAMAAHRLSRLFRCQISDLLAEHSTLSLVDWRICLGLSLQPTVSQKELVRYSEMEQGQVSRSLSVMEERGLIQSHRCEQDRRMRKFSMTDLGWAHFNEVRPIVAAHWEVIDNSISAEDFNRFLKIAERMAETSVSGGAGLGQRVEEAAQALPGQLPSNTQNNNGRT